MDALIEIAAIGLSMLVTIWVGLSRLTSRIDSRLGQVVDVLNRVVERLREHDAKLDEVRMTQVEHGGRLTGLEKSISRRNDGGGGK